MAITLSSQAVNATPTTTSTTHSATVTAATGDLLIIQVASRDNQAVTGVQDDLTNAFTRAGSASYESGSGYYAEIWYLANATAGSRTVTVTFAGTTRAAVNLSNWAGAATSSVLDQNSQATEAASTTAHDHGSITTTGAGLIIQAYSFVGSPGTRTPETDFTAMTVTDGSGYDRCGFFYRLVTGSTASSGTVTTANSITSAGKIASFNEAGGGGATPTITDAGDETYTNGETGIVITGTNFGASQGTGTVKISPTDNVNDSNAITQTVTSWSDTSITFTAVRSTLPASTNLYLFVTANGSYSNASGHVVSFNQVVTVTNVSDTTLMDGQTSVIITGTDFQSTQGTGRVVISPTNSISDVNAVAQTVTSWADTSITFTAARSSLSFSTNLYLFVENDDDVSNATGYTVQFTGTKKLRVAVAPAAAGVSGVYGVVWAEPTAAPSPNAGYTFDATGEKLETTGQLALTDHPFTMFCWIKVADGTPASTQTAFSIGNSAYGSDRYCSLQLTAADGYARALAYHTTSSSSTTASNGCADNTWYAIAGLFDRNTSSQVTSIQAWSWNGTNESLSTAVTGLTKQMSTFDLNRVGMSRTGTGELQGLVAHVAVWNRLLTAGELTQLRTQLPSTVATSNLIAYWPLTADANAVVGSSINLTATGATLTAGDGPYPQTEQAGAEVGEFTNQSFESSTEGGLAVLKVPVTAFGGTSLTTSDTPVVLVQTSTHTTGLIEATIIEE